MYVCFLNRNFYGETTLFYLRLRRVDENCANRVMSTETQRDTLLGYAKKWEFHIVGEHVKIKLLIWYNRCRIFDKGRNKGY